MLRFVVGNARLICCRGPRSVCHSDCILKQRSIILLISISICVKAGSPWSTVHQLRQRHVLLLFGTFSCSASWHQPNTSDAKRFTKVPSLSSIASELLSFLCVLLFMGKVIVTEDKCCPGTSSRQKHRPLS